MTHLLHSRNIFFVGLLVLLTFSPVFFVRADDMSRDHEEIIEEYRAILSELLLEPQDTTTLKEIGKISFHLGQETHDRDSIKKAISIFKEILQIEPDNAEIITFLGSAYALKARDFPMKWLANVTPLGWIRLYYVQKGIGLLNDGVKQDEKHPVVRFIRGLTFVHLPRVFGQFSQGMSDLELVLSWVDSPSLNEGYSELITDRAFMGDVYYRVGEVYRERDNKEKALLLFEKAASLFPDTTPIGKIVLRRLSE